MIHEKLMDDTHHLTRIIHQNTSTATRDREIFFVTHERLLPRERRFQK